MEPSRHIFKSKVSYHLAFVAFQNQTERNVDIIWVDFQGNFRYYKTMKPTEIIYLDTYVHYAFVFLDSINRDQMLVDGKAFYYAEPVGMQFRIIDNQIQRVVSAVHLPLRTLKSLAMLAVRDMLPNVEAVQHLELPELVKRELALSLYIKKKPIHECSEFFQIE